MSPCSVPDSCGCKYTQHAAPTSSQTPPNPEFQYTASISHQRPGRNDTSLGKAPAENNKRCRDGGGFCCRYWNVITATAVPAALAGL
ncbi:hypothetical protein J7T55_014556 [Diaporthe amygdali]|uniref:uncharacterized protein n=1 Tax=Phomopsis amygdali TaxID=1214568 RepID=UPI0022FE1203|nr:uncharacterized protein J7T55_014556 [Diaporthe amygdali]KAJ0118103.1 hypothetical protein J7T55_014556 [Diaporthe amygdali]